MKYRWIRGGRVLLMLAIAAALGGVVMALWNWVMPGLYFGINPIDYWHALGLLVLARILVGGFRGHGRHGWHGWHDRHHWHKWQKWQTMTEQEREQFFRDRHDLFRHPDHTVDSNHA